MHWHAAVLETYNWLVVNGLWRDVIAVLTAALVGWLLRVGKRLKKIEHLLDTSKPGGLTDVVTALSNQPAPPDNKKVD